MLISKKVEEEFLRLIRSDSLGNIHLGLHIAKGFKSLQRTIRIYNKVYMKIFAPGEEDHIFWTSTVFGVDIPKLNIPERIAWINSRNNIFDVRYVDFIPKEISFFDKAKGFKM